MLLSISDMPQNIKLCKVLTYDKIRHKSTSIETLPKRESDIPAFNAQKGDDFPSEALMNTCWRMIRACLSDDGVGLAAPQIGIFKQLFVIREDNETFRVYFHPRFTVDTMSKTEAAIEGCLSVPGKNLSIPRSTIISAEWIEINEQGEAVAKTELLEGFKARVFQHEHDHLLGISIIDRARQAKTYR